MTAEQLAQRFHELYEELAPLHGYETRKESAVPWDQVPQKNRKLMIAVCSRVGVEVVRDFMGRAEKRWKRGPYAFREHALEELAAMEAEVKE